MNKLYTAGTVVMGIGMAMIVTAVDREAFHRGQESVVWTEADKPMKVKDEI